MKRSPLLKQSIYECLSIQATDYEHFLRAHTAVMSVHGALV
jgi:hypothetical protein